MLEKYEDISSISSAAAAGARATEPETVQRGADALQRAIGMPPELALRQALPDPELALAVADWFEARQAEPKAEVLRKPIGFVRRLMADPAGFGWNRVDGHWKPPPGGADLSAAARRRLVEKRQADHRTAQEARQRERSQDQATAEDSRRRDEADRVRWFALPELTRLAIEAELQRSRPEQYGGREFDSSYVFRVACIAEMNRRFPLKDAEGGR